MNENKTFNNLLNYRIISHKQIIKNEDYKKVFVPLFSIFFKNKKL